MWKLIKETKIKFLIIFALLSWLSCSESINDSVTGNMAPETFMFLYPDSSISQQKSRLNVHWWGDDPDGLIEGYYFKWEGLDSVWQFTTKNDSIFSLPIGTVDTNYTFKVVAADNGGNGKYDNKILRNDTDFGPEPFIDDNSDGIYSVGEQYIDIGLIDPSPAEQKFPIKNSSPTIEWNEASNLPPSSFPVITIAWDADDLDGIESITKIHLALNDTSEFISLDGPTRIVTLRIKDLNAAEPEMEVLVGGLETNIFSETLKNLMLDDFNNLYVQAEDISGAKSPFVILPDTNSTWFVKKPKGELLIIDDFLSGPVVQDFYLNAFNSMQGGILIDKYDEFDLINEELPFQNITFLETIKLFNYIFWYSDQDPRLDLSSLITQDYLEGGGKIAFSMTFRDSSDDFLFDLATLQNFLPINSLGQTEPVNFVFPGANILIDTVGLDYPNLVTATTIGFVRTYVPNEISADEIYDISSSAINGNIAFLDKQKNLFFIGLPLNQCDGIPGTVQTLLEKIFFDEFGLSP